MTLTKEHFDEQIKTLATKNDIARVEQKITDAVDELATIVGETIATPMQQHFEQLHSELSMRERLKHVEGELHKIKLALHIS